MNRRQSQRASFLSGLGNLLNFDKFSDIFDEIDSEYGLVDDERDDDAITIDDWVEELISIQESHSRQIANRASKVRCSFDAVSISCNG